MTEKQAELYRWLWARRHDLVSPSYEEIRTAMALKSKSGVARMVADLEERGYIRRTPRTFRSIELTDRVPLGVTQQVAEMWAYETDRHDRPGDRIVQPLSLCFMSSDLPNRLKADPTMNPVPCRVRVTIERID